MRRFFRRLAVCAALFCANPRAFLWAVGHPGSAQGRELRALLRDTLP